ncbi:MAG TPA: heavy metal translocating P-type ATPase metal-binding domain-containing protein [bacterium]|nr:heavy metal translocating P-type ATPase metal-binding domain-containing protein [bacterium]
MSTTGPHPAISCFHCGLSCAEDAPAIDEKRFCCEGCRTVYRLLQDARLGSYYARDAAPGARPTLTDRSRFAYLDLPETVAALLEYQDERQARVTLSVPGIHCASCVWLLENLYRLDAGIVRSTANLATRHLTILFDHRRITLRGVVELLARIGYEPDIRLAALGQKAGRSPAWKLYARLGVAGFGFANVMLFSLPEYFSAGQISEGGLSTTFRFASLVLAIPVLLYAAQDYFRSAWASLRQRMINLDVPLALGIGMLFARSAFDVLFDVGPGYFDSLTGLVFFLLAGRVFQQKTFAHLSFDRDYRSYFPISCLRRDGACDTTVSIAGLRSGDRIVVRHQELIPADSILVFGEAHIDYSFVTGESVPRQVAAGQRVYAGGRQTGGAIELEVIRPVAQSNLVSLWSSDQFVQARAGARRSIADRIGQYFTFAVLLIAAGTAAAWAMIDPDRLPHAVTSVLVVACPCALALARPFVFGTAVRIWGDQRLFVRAADVVEAMAEVDEIIFDKTGTLTQAQGQRVAYEGEALTDKERELVAAVARQSTHPLSRRVAATAAVGALTPVTHFEEVPGHGISGEVDGHTVRLGTRDWASFGNAMREGREANSDASGQVVHVGFDHRRRGVYVFSAAYREGLDGVLAELRGRYQLAVLTGDTRAEDERLRALFGDEVALRSHQSPHDKLDYVTVRQQAGHQVMMVGDGLNDAGALRAARVGIAVSEDSAAFAPASDGVLEAGALMRLPRFLRMAQRARGVVYLSFVVSLVYNVIGLSFAASGHLSPLVSAILMPVSSVTVVMLATVATRWVARREGLA